MHGYSLSSRAPYNPYPMPIPFARRTAWNLTTNRYTQALEAHRLAGKATLDLTASNPTTVGIQYREELLLPALANREGLQYEPEAKGLRSARESVVEYYAERGSRGGGSAGHRALPARRPT